jgi:hypothetical protein
VGKKTPPVDHYITPSFPFIEHTAFHKVLFLMLDSTIPPEIPSAKVIRHRLKRLRARAATKPLPYPTPSAKLSLALDCWTSPFRQSFMAVTGYFLDWDWEYREILLGFESLSETHSGVNFSAVLMDLLQQHKITYHVLEITTDNAPNNNTLISSVQDSTNLLEIDNGSTIIRVPCIARVMQLSPNDLLG